MYANKDGTVFSTWKEKTIMSKLITMDKLTPGAVLADEVLSMNGQTLLKKGVTLTPRHITLLTTWSIQGVFVESAADDEPDPAAEPAIGQDPQISPAFKKFQSEFDSIGANLYQSFDIIRDHHIVPVAKIKEDAMGIHTSVANNYEILNHLLSYPPDMSHPITAHSLMTAYYTDLIAQRMDWAPKDIEGVTLAALLHDIGNLTIKGTASIKEARIAETAGLLKFAKGLPLEVIMGIIQHREYLNGTGFPKRSRGEQIHPYARLLAVADSFHYLTYDKDIINPFPALDMFKRNMYEKLDPTIVQTFLDSLKDTLTMNRIELTDGRQANIIFFNKDNLQMPVVKTDDNSIIDLAGQMSLRIARLMPMPGQQKSV